MQLRRYATPGIVAQAASKGIELVPIGISAADRPLRDQGPFHAILHKLLPDDPFYDELESYCSANPHVRVLDEFKHVNSIRNREGMLHALKEGLITSNPCDPKKSSMRDGCASEIAASSSHGAPQVPVSCTYSAPKQVTVPRGSSLGDIRKRLATAAIVFPIMSKPLQADGSDGSHCISLFLTEHALEVRVGRKRPDHHIVQWSENLTSRIPAARIIAAVDLFDAVPFLTRQSPGRALAKQLRGKQSHMQALISPDTRKTAEHIILQQFEEHNGVLYKCYVLGDLTEIHLRPSLHVSPDLIATSDSSGVLILPRFSTTPLPASGGLALDIPDGITPQVALPNSHSAPPPPRNRASHSPACMRMPFM